MRRDLDPPDDDLDDDFGDDLDDADDLDDDELDDDDLDDAPAPDDDLDDDPTLDAAFPLGDGVADRTAEVWCPYCGEPNEIAVDPGSGETQEYVEDCQVCCQPWQVIVHYGSDGAADVSVVTLDDG